MGAVLAVVLVPVVAACAPSSRADILPMGVSPVPVPVPDPAVTDKVCRDATAAVNATTVVFNEQLNAIDTAAAAGDQGAIMKAADTIQTRFVSLADSLASWGEMPVQAKVRAALTGGAATLRTITAETYTGDQTDIAQQLGKLSHTLQAACG
jgi:hypothetical protein